MKIFLYITDDLFDKSLAFLDDLKARNLDAFVFSILQEENQKKISDLGFSFVDGNPYEVLAREDGQSILVSSFDKFLPENLEQGIICSGVSTYNVENIVLPINNIYQRVDVANLLENNLINKIGNLLSIHYVGAPQDFWIALNGVYKKWIEDSFVSSSPVLHDLVFNFCVAFFDKSHLIGSENG